jgi:glycosyltransferase involved in cell wall biosynthesis
MRVGILSSHPIQYQAPWFRALAREAEVKVFFAHRQSAEEQGKAGFGVAFEWDVDLLSGYDHQFLKNISRKPGTGSFAGCDTPEIAEIIGSPTSRGPKSFDAFIVNGWHLKSYWQASKACRAAGVPVLVRGDSHLSTSRSWIKRVAMEFTHRWLIRQFDGFLAVGKRNRTYLEHFGASPERIFSVPHFVDNSWFAEKASEARGRRTAVRMSWGACESTFVALFVGKFQAIKRPLDLLRALAYLNEQHTPASKQRLLAVFVGAGALEGELHAEAKKLNVDAHFAGFKNQGELPSCYVAADVLVLPSVCETWGLVVNEAMACGLPAIVSDTVGCETDLIDAFQTGLVFPVGDTTTLANRIAELKSLNATGYNFSVALAEKIQLYSASTAVKGTMRGLIETIYRTSGRTEQLAQQE